MKRDLTPFFHDWPVDPNDICVRKILGNDGQEKLQVRLELGILQMALYGRPDGAKPHGHSSLLEYYLNRLENHRAESGSDVDFRLDADACGDLGQEGVLFNHRYICLLRLGDFDGVVCDTTHNLAILDLVKSYAEDDEDRRSFEQYRPYVLMIHTRGRGELCLQTSDYQGALKRIEEGMSKIRASAESFDGVDAEEELQALSAWAEEIDRGQPLSLEQRLTQELQTAIAEERYEVAARLRDRLQSLTRPRS